MRELFPIRTSFAVKEERARLCDVNLEDLLVHSIASINSFCVHSKKYSNLCFIYKDLAEMDCDSRLLRNYSGIKFKQEYS